MKMDKQRILQSCIDKQQELIDSFKKREADMKDDTFNQNESASQSEDRRGNKFELLKIIGDQLAFAQQEMILLNSLDATKENTIVESGAFVVTNKLSFYIGVSSEKVEIDDLTFYGISIKAPIYASMRGLKKGDSFQFNESDYSIEEVY